MGFGLSWLFPGKFIVGNANEGKFFGTYLNKKCSYIVFSNSMQKLISNSKSFQMSSFYGFIFGIEN